MGRLIRHVPVPPYAVCADDVTIDIGESAIALSWRGFAQQRPRMLRSRQTAQSMLEAMWPRPFEWRWVWNFDGHRHLQTITMTVTDSRRHDYPIAAWTVAEDAVAVSRQKSADAPEDILVSSKLHAQWVSVALQLLFTYMLNAPIQWLTPIEQQTVGHELANTASHHWLKRWPVFLLLTPVFLGAVLLLLQSDPSAAPRWVFAGLTLSPFILGTGAYTAIQSRAWKKITNPKLPPVS
jgi:hypothetical protein